MDGNLRRDDCAYLVDWRILGVFKKGGGAFLEYV